MFFCFLCFKKQNIMIWEQVDLMSFIFHDEGGKWRRLSCGCGQILYEGQTTLDISRDKHPLDCDNEAFQGRNIIFYWSWFYIYIKGSFLIFSCYSFIYVSAKVTFLGCHQFRFLLLFYTFLISYLLFLVLHDKKYGYFTSSILRKKYVQPLAENALDVKLVQTLGVF